MNRLLICLLFFCCQTILSQESSLIFNKLNLSVFNPAYTGIEGASVSLNTRAQWLGLEDAPLTNFLLIHLPSKKNVSLGFTIQNDRVFVENKSLLTFDYNYKLQLSDKSNIYLGLKLGGMFFNVDANNIPRIFNVPNQSVASLENYFSPIIGAGVTIISDKFYLGVASPGLLNNIGLDKNSEWELTTRDFSYLNLSGGLFININETIKLKPSVIYRYIPRNPNLLNSVFEIDFNDKFSLGSIYSNNDRLGAFFKVKGKKGFQLGYGYEFLVASNSYSINNSTHELMIRIDLKKKTTTNPENTINETTEDEN